jgi:hypothetical protein
VVEAKDPFANESGRGLMNCRMRHFRHRSSLSLVPQQLALSKDNILPRALRKSDFSSG